MVRLQLRLDLHRELILHEGSPLYPVTRVGKAEPVATPGNRHPCTVAVGPIRNRADAEVKCARTASRRGVEWTGQW